MRLYTEILFSSEYKWGKDKDVPVYELEISSQHPLCLAQTSTVPFIMAAVLCPFHWKELFPFLPSKPVSPIIHSEI